MLKKPRVAIITPGTFPIPSSRSSSVERVVNNVSQRLKTKVQLLIFGKKTKGQSWYEKDHGITYLRPFYRKRLNYLVQIKRRILSLRPAIIQIENRPRFARFFKKHFPHKQVWLSLHSTQFITPPHIQSKELRDCLKRVDKIIVNSEFLKEKLLSYEPHMSGKIETIYLGVNPHQFVPKWSEKGQQLKSELLNDLGYKDKQIILYVGRLIEIKGVHHLLHAMPTIIQHFPNAILVIVGSAFYGRNIVTPYVAKLHQMGNRLPKNVRFVPFVAYHDIQKWFSIADVVVVPSAENEAFGLVNVEAMASGVPVIATNAGGMKEIIQHGQTGFLIDPQRMHEELAATLLYLLSDSDARKTMGEASINRVYQHFTWEHTANRYYDLYQG